MAISKNTLKRIFSNRTKKVNRSKAGNMGIFLFIAVIAAYSVIPLILLISNSLKPISELYIYPPRIFPIEPTFDNFTTLFELMSSTWIPFSRYVFNTFFVTFATTGIHLVIASMAAYPLSKHKFRGKNFINTLIMYSLMFVPAVTDVVNYMTISSLGMINTYFAMILPNVYYTMGIFLLRNYMTTIPTTLIEAAKIDGCHEWKILWKIIMPMAKPAWLTLMILMVQNMWGNPNTTYIYAEKYKTLPAALSQITSGGLIRAGAGQAVGVIMLIVPAVIFLINQTKMIETMASSGIKE
ncbi:MAG: carbohydrate ABC transporter permease [Clostridia bacterium]|nr:carbohydrate ABC transporter permease [Clostridia bacterium]